MNKDHGKDSNLVDWDALEELRALGAGDEREGQFLAEIIQLYRKVGEECLSGLDKAYFAQNSNQILRWAHKLKGSSRNVGAKKLGSLCDSLESRARANGNILETEIKEISTVYEETLDQLLKVG